LFGKDGGEFPVDEAGDVAIFVDKDICFVEIRMCQEKLVGSIFDVGMEDAKEVIMDFESIFKSLTVLVGKLLLHPVRPTDVKQVAVIL
jgi:hypothetical protein